MRVITIEAEVGQDRRLILELPPDTPIGRVKLVIQSLGEAPMLERQSLTREEARHRLHAAGKLLKMPVAPQGTTRSNDEEDHRLSNLFGAGPSVEGLIDVDRGPRE